MHIMINPLLRVMVFCVDVAARILMIVRLASAAKQASQFWQSKSADDNGRDAAPYRPAGDPGNADRGQRAPDDGMGW